nr:unnamed protein product [Callosobruchus chinensis]
MCGDVQKNWYTQRKCLPMKF